jgi:hypothetical protein
LSAGIGRAIVKRVLIVTAATALIAGGTGSLMSAYADGGRGGGRGAGRGAAAGKGTFIMCSAGAFDSFAKFDYGEEIDGQGKGKGKGKGEGAGRGRGRGAEGRGAEGRGQGQGKGQGKGKGKGKGKGGEKLAQDSGVVPAGKCVVENIVGLGKGAKAELYTIDQAGKKVDIGSVPFQKNKLMVAIAGTADQPAIFDMTSGQIKNVPVKAGGPDKDDDDD